MSSTATIRNRLAALEERVRGMRREVCTECGGHDPWYGTGPLVSLLKDGTRIPLAPYCERCWQPIDTEGKGTAPSDPHGKVGSRPAMILLGERDRDPAALRDREGA